MQKGIEVVKKLLENLILPKYHQIKNIQEIETFETFHPTTHYFINLVMNEYVEPSIQKKINDEVKDLFLMAGIKNLDNIENVKSHVYFDFQDGQGFVYEWERN